MLLLLILLQSLGGWLEARDVVGSYTKSRHTLLSPISVLLLGPFTTADLGLPSAIFELNGAEAPSRLSFTQSSQTPPFDRRDPPFSAPRDWTQFTEK